MVKSDRQMISSWLDFDHGDDWVTSMYMPNSTHSITTLLFDWDGTLADSAPLGLAAFQKTFAEMRVPFSQELYEAAYSPNWYSIYEALGLPREEWQRADDLWIEHYGEETAPLVAGVADTIRDLHQKGYRLGVVTSGSEGRVCREIEHAGLSEVFEVVICNEHIVNKKPHPEGLEIAMRKLKQGNEECCYVGDAPEDIEMGKRAGLLTIGVRSSYPSSARLLEAKPDIYVESLTGLSVYFRRAL